MQQNTQIIIFLILLVVFFCWKSGLKEFFDGEVIQNPTYLRQTTYPEDMQYQQGVIQHKDHEIKRLRKQVRKMAEIIDDGDDCGYHKFYRRKLSNKYYPVAPAMSDAVGNELNLQDDDFSNKTLSTIKFLSQTRKSKYYGTEIHFPSELCGNFCTTSDPNARYHEQIDLIRPVAQASYIRREAK